MIAAFLVMALALTNFSNNSTSAKTAEILPAELPNDIDVVGIARDNLKAQGQTLIMPGFIAKYPYEHWRHYPLKAWKKSIQGEAVALCQFEYDHEGRLKNCQTIYEIPDNYGFGDATLNVANQYYRVDLKKVSPTDANSYVLFRLKWRFNDVPLIVNPKN